MKVTKSIVGQVAGQDVELIALEGNDGTSVKITNLGATITSIKTPDRDGNVGEIVLGFDDALMYADEAYLNLGFFLGATVGRYANRIAGGKFTIDGKTYDLEINNGPNHLHGGSGSFNTKFWNSSVFESDGRVGVKMEYVSANMENGYPGNLTVSVVFTLTASNELQISYRATTDKKTHLNLTNHSYFNLSGKGNVLSTEVQMNASNYTPKDEVNIPTGDIESVKGTPLDFLLPHKIGERIMMYEDGYDHNLVIDGNPGSLRQAAEAYDPASGRVLTFSTTEPGFQFYTAYYMGGQFERNGLKFDRFGGFCFEAQHYPDSPNKPMFPSTLLSPGEVYTQTSIYKFSVRK